MPASASPSAAGPRLSYPVMSVSPHHFHTMAALVYLLDIIAELLEGTARLVRFFATIAGPRHAEANLGQGPQRQHPTGGSPGVASREDHPRPSCRRSQVGASQGSRHSGGSEDDDSAVSEGGRQDLASPRTSGQDHAGPSSGGQDHDGPRSCGRTLPEVPMLIPASWRFATDKRLSSREWLLPQGSHLHRPVDSRRRRETKFSADQAC